jgi:hypothetical protein
MKKLLITFLLAISSLFTLTSCVTSAVAQDEVYVSTSIETNGIELAIRYGTPYIVEDAIVYYFYNNLYYYPFYLDGHYRYRVFSRPLSVYPRHWRPIPRNGHRRFSSEFRYHSGRPDARPHRPIDRRPSGNHNMSPRPNRGNVSFPRVSPNRTFTPGSRNITPRGSNSRSNGHFGGRR